MIRNKFTVLSLVAALALLVGAGVASAVVLFNNPSVATEDADVPLAYWTGKNNVFASDDQRAHAYFYDLPMDVPQNFVWVTKYLKATGFSLAIPANATITGIEVEVEKNATNGTSTDRVTDYSVRLIKNGTITGADRADHETKWPYSNQENILPASNYGSSTDLWSTTWTPAQLNSSGFGVAVSAIRRKAQNGGVPGSSVFIDNIRVKVSYTVPEV